jgi:hypothetical protein
MSEPASIQVHIEELVLDGFAQRDRYAIAEALEQELGRLLREHGVAERLLRQGRAAEIDAGQVQIGSSATPAAVGVHAAQAVQRGLSG